ncbi:MAG: ArsS family sensor histidine kinase [Sulfuricurvum sp.]|uniref:ArsS family sensor histidine kinase n=1 Tax=Sulfuricurvum sp. TaxID=2025608 RepID=UPI00261D011D|nr:ArsS family sensor histidine kinase [Sulfuricurvum sp.]MDD2829773.1 ArsS family sensor histidine kinase [Sulfuricurvum sp.]MDD4948433.1 ArsS family sensor histidine kinase [Sulfuricurvum sp.]
MISRRHSVFFKLHAFFALALIVLSLLFISALSEQKEQKFHLLAHRSMELSRILEEAPIRTCMEQNQELKEAGFRPIETLSPHCEPIPIPPPMRAKLQSRNVKVTIYKDHNGFVYALARENCTMYYRDTAEEPTYYFVWFLFFALLGGLVSMYLLLWSNLKPLKALYETIHHYGEGEEMSISHSNGKDEIALISNALSDALEKQNRLKKSRELFLRNMMHELKTPITKGKFIVELEENTPNITLLGKLFTRMEHLISQMAQVEKMHAFSLSTHPCSIKNMIESTIDNLLLNEENIEIQGCDREIEVDSALFTSALQNLIDNAYRHATAYPILIRCDAHKICIQNSGEPLKRPVEEALQAFVTERGDGGLGLGLYIAQSVCELHRFSLEYHYDEGIHYFCIRF